MRFFAPLKRALRPLTSRLTRLRNRYYLMMDVAMLCFTPVAALWLRMDGSPQAMAPFLGPLLTYVLAAMAIRLVLFYYFGLYNRYWRSASITEFAQTAEAVLTSSILIFCLFFAIRQFDLGILQIPRSIPFLDSLLVLIGIGAIRVSARLAERAPIQEPQSDTQRVLIVGAGIIGQSIVRELQANPQLGMRPVGFIDDDAQKLYLHILDLPVMGNRAALPDVVRHHRVDQVIIAMPHESGKRIREVRELCDSVNVPAKIVPGMSTILGGRVNISHLRHVDIEDLLRREPIQTDIAAVQRLLRGKRVLITGAGGSIGSELCRQALQCEPAEMGLLGHGENSVFEILNELKNFQRRAARNTLGGGAPSTSTNITPFIADIRFPIRVRNVIEEFRPDIIFHAAAHKHVPLMESNPAEAISNNVFGTRNVLNAAMLMGVEHFVMISTDKAVNPTSVMGASKRMAELLVLRAAQQCGRSYVAVRFGNVLGSRGSVVPIFRRQIAEGGPITVSHPDMTRYFMTIPEAVQLVLQASALGSGGEVFMLDMGEPVKIMDLARDLIELSGLEVDKDIDIVITGLRPGEKLFEELLTTGESYQPTPHEKIRIARDASGAAPAALDEILVSLEKSVAQDDRAEIVRSLQTLIPEFQPDEMRAVNGQGSGFRVQGSVSNAQRAAVSGQR